MRAAATVDKPVLVILGGRGRASVAALRELLSFREVLWAFAVRFVKVKYKQAAIGIGWALLQPLLLAALFAIFLGRLAHVSSEGVPYLAFALAGLAPWTFFSTSAGLSMESLVNDQALLRKVYFPREVLPVAAVLAGLVDLVPALLLLLVVTAGYGIVPGIQWIALPIPIAVLTVFALALGIGLSGVNVYYRDVRYALPFVLQLILFASPILYPLQLVPSGWRMVYAILNPVAAGVDGVRRIVLHQQWPSLSVSLAALGWSVVALGLAYALFKRIERGFADQV